MWHLVPGQLLMYRGWDDEFVVYNNLSGDTHLLGVDAMRLLLSLQSAGGQDEQGLLGSTCRAESSATGACDEDEPSELLAVLRDISLIETF